MIGVSAAKGEVLWEYPFDGGGGGPMPVAYAGTIIVSGLKAGEKLIVGGIQKIRDGAPISAATPAAPARQGGGA